MKLLLDTHIWLWSQLDPRRLKKRVASALIRPGNELWLSPISIWETLLLADKGRLRIKGDPVCWISTLLEKVPMKEANLTHEVAKTSRKVWLPHEDPADRFLAATADVFNLVLVTGDVNLLKGKGFRTLANA